MQKILHQLIPIISYLLLSHDITRLEYHGKIDILLNQFICSPDSHFYLRTDKRKRRNFLTSCDIDYRMSNIQFVTLSLA